MVLSGQATLAQIHTLLFRSWLRPEFADGLDQAVTPFPGTKGDGPHAGQLRHRSDRVQLFTRVLDNRCLCVHSLIRPLKSVCLSNLARNDTGHVPKVQSFSENPKKALSVYIQNLYIYPNCVL